MVNFNAGLCFQGAKKKKDCQSGLLKTWIRSSSYFTCSSDNTNITSNTEENKDSSIMSYVQKEVFKAEILWTLNLVRGHQSYNCSKNTSFSMSFAVSSYLKTGKCV